MSENWTREDMVRMMGSEGGADIAKMASDALAELDELWDSINEWEINHYTAFNHDCAGTGTYDHATRDKIDADFCHASSRIKTGLRFPMIRKYD